eukprot:1105688_1
MKNGIHQVSINQLRSDLMHLEDKTPSKYEKRMPKREILKDREAIDGRSTSFEKKTKRATKRCKRKGKTHGNCFECTFQQLREHQNMTQKGVDEKKKTKPKQRQNTMGIAANVDFDAS